MMKPATSPDLVALVNNHDEVIGEMDKVEAHRGDAQLHRAISVFLFNERGELLSQQRSAEKIVGAGQWVNTCCGNVRPTETYQECALRRLREELGITDATIKPVVKFQYFARCNNEFSEREIDQVFVGRWNGVPKPNPREVQAIKWVSWEALVTAWQQRQQVGAIACEEDSQGVWGLSWQFDDRARGMLAPWLAEMLKRENVVNAIQQFLEKST